MGKWLIKAENFYSGETREEALFKFKSDVVNGYHITMQQKEE